MMIRYMGLDVHKKETEVCVMDQAGTILTRQRLAPSQAALAHFAQGLTPDDHLALEATTNCWAVAECLRERAGEVVVSNPLLTKAIASAKVKTDKVDAEVLAHLLRLDYLPRVWTPDAPTRELRELTSYRTALVQDKTALKNRLHSVLHQSLLAFPGQDLFAPPGRAWLKTEAPLEPERKLRVEADLRLLEHVEKELAQVDQTLAKRATQDPRVKLLLTLPGVDVAVALGLLAVIGDVSRFSTPDKLASYLGLTPRTKQSAEQCHHGPITKAGPSHARWLLVQAAQHMEKNPGPLGHFFRRLKNKKGHNIAVVAAARKLALLCWYVLTTGEPYRYAVPRSTEMKLARLRIKATGERRISGPPKGRPQPHSPSKPTFRYRKTLPEVYASEGVPPLGPLPPGETAIHRVYLLRKETKNGIVGISK